MNEAREELAVELHQLSLADAGEVLTLQRAAYATEAQIYNDPFLPALTQTIEELREEIESGDGLTLRLSERLIGAVRTVTTGDEIHIGRLTIAPDLQGLGLGSRLLREVEMATSAHYAELFTGHLSNANLRMYKRLGYEHSHRESLREGVELVYLRKRLG